MLLCVKSTELGSVLYSQGLKQPVGLQGSQLQAIPRPFTRGIRGKEAQNPQVAVMCGHVRREALRHAQPCHTLTGMHTSTINILRNAQQVQSSVAEMLAEQDAGGGAQRGDH